jgi:hypothetical protein
VGWRRGLVLALELTLEGPGSRHSSAPVPSWLLGSGVDNGIGWFVGNLGIRSRF